MKKIAVNLFLLLLCVTAQAQVSSEQLAQTSKILQEKIGKEMPGWIHHSIEPMEGSKNVIIEQWELRGVIVKVAVAKYDTQAQATQALKDFKSQLKIQEQSIVANGNKEFHLLKEDLPTLGNGGLTWDIRGSEAAAFRKGDFLVHISVARPENNNDIKLSKEFAKHVIDVLPAQ